MSSKNIYPPFATNPSFIEDSKGKRQLVAVDAAHSGVVHISFEGSDLTDHRWTPAKIFGTRASSPISGVSLVENTVSDPGSLRVLANANGKLLHLSRGGQTGVWNEPNPVLSSINVTGVPAIIQHTYQNQGNLDLVSPAAKGGLFQSYLDRGIPTGTWAKPVFFAEEIGIVSGAGLTQIPTWPDGSPGWLEVVAIAGNKIWNTYRNGQGQWQPVEHILPDYKVKGNPAFIMGRFGKEGGNFELVVSPTEGGGLVHFTRQNDVRPFSWGPGTRFGVGLGDVSGVSIIHGKDSGPFPQSLEVIANAHGKLWRFWRVGQTWVGPVPVEPKWTKLSTCAGPDIAAMVCGAVVSFPSRPSACVDIWGLAVRTCVWGTGEGGGWGVGGFGTFSRGANYLNERPDSRSHSFLNRIAEEIIPIRYHRLFFSDNCVQFFPV